MSEEISNIAVEDRPQEYPHQTSENVTTRHLLDHYTRHPEMYHEGLKPHIERILSIAGKSDVLLEGAVEKPEGSSAEIESDNGVHKIISEDLLTLLVIAQVADPNNYDLRRMLDTAKTVYGLPEEEMTRRLEVDYYLSRDYQQVKDFVAQIREQQTEYIDQQMAQVQDAPQDVQAMQLIQALSYSPGLAKSFMSKVSVGENWNTQRAYSDEVVDEASKDPEVFAKLLEQSFIKNPVGMADYLPVLLQVVDRDLIKSVVMSDAERIADTMECNRFMQVFETPEEKMEFINIITNTDGGIVNVLSKSMYFDLLSESQYRELLQGAIDSGKNLPPSVYIKALASSYITQETFISCIKSQNTDIYDFETILKSSEVPEVVKTQLKNDYLNSIINNARKYSRPSIFSIKELIESGVMTQDDYIGAFKVLIESDALENLDYLSLCTELEIDWREHFDIKSIQEKLIGCDPRTLLTKSDQLERLGILSPEELKEMVYAMNPEDLFSLRWYVQGILGPEELEKTIRQAFFDLSSEDKKNRLSEAAKYLTPEEINNIANELVEAGHVFTQHSLGKDVQEKIGAEKVHDLLEKSFHNALNKPGRLIWYDITEYIKYVESQSGKESALKYFNEAWKSADLDGVLKLVSELGYLLKAETIRSELEVYLGTDKNVVEILESYHGPELINKYFDATEVENLCRRYMAINPAKVLKGMDNLKKMMPEATEEQVINSALADSGPMGAMGGYLQEMYSRVQKTDKQGTKDALLVEMSAAYDMYGFIAESGSTELLQKIRNQEGALKQGEFNLIEKTFVAARYRSPEELSVVDTLEDLNTQIFEGLAAACGLTINLEPNLIENIRKAEREIQTLGVYFNRYRNSEGHKDVVTGIIRSIIDGSYEQWRFGAPASLEDVKAQGLLPESLTNEQYEKWMRDDSTEAREAFRVEASTAVSEMQIALQENRQFLGDVESIDSDVGNIKIIGQELERIGRELQSARSLNDQDSINNLLSEQLKVRESLQRLQIAEDIAMLLGITEEEISSGLVGVSASSKGRRIDAILDRLAKNMPEDNAFIISRLRSVYESYKTQTGEIRGVTLQDSSDLLLTLRIGADPVPSCQNYRDGVMNEALLGYTDPNTKMIVLKNEKGSVIGRSVFRLFESSSGEPALHIETIYSQDVSEGATRAVYRHAIKKAREMGVPVYISKQSQNQIGEMRGSKSVERVVFKPAEGVSLTSRGSRAPYVYVDSAGGRQPDGKYEIKDLELLIEEHEEINNG